MSETENLDRHAAFILRRARATFRGHKRYRVSHPKGWRPREMRSDESLRIMGRFMTRAEWLAIHYPITMLRRRVKKVLTLLDDQQVVCVYSPIYQNRTRPRQSGLLTVAKAEQFGAVMVFWAPTWRDYEVALRNSLSPAFARRCLDDLIVAALLHEGFHLTEQVIPRRPRCETGVPVLDDEVPCWAYTCTEVIQPMIAHGRAPLLISGNGDVLYRIWNAFFELIGCDAQSPVWRRFIECQYLREEAPTL